MNFKEKIKELSNKAKKIKIRNLGFKETFGFYFFSIGIFPMCMLFNILVIYSSLFIDKSLNFPNIIIAVLLMSAYFILFKEHKKMLKEQNYIIEQKNIVEFIQSYPEEYEEQVKNYITERIGKKKTFSLFDLKILEKSITIKGLKNIKENEIFFKQDYEKIILEKETSQV